MRPGIMRPRWAIVGLAACGLMMAAAGGSVAQDNPIVPVNGAMGLPAEAVDLLYTCSSWRPLEGDKQGTGRVVHPVAIGDRSRDETRLPGYVTTGGRAVLGEFRFSSSTILALFADPASKTLTGDFTTQARRPSGIAFVSGAANLSNVTTGRFSKLAIRGSLGFMECEKGISVANLVPAVGASAKPEMIKPEVGASPRWSLESLLDGPDARPSLGDHFSKWGEKGELKDGGPSLTDLSKKFPGDGAKEPPPVPRAPSLADKFAKPAETGELAKPAEKGERKDSATYLRDLEERLERLERLTREGRPSGVAPLEKNLAEDVSGEPRTTGATR